MARCSDHRGQGPRPGPVPRAPRGLLHPRAVVEGEEAENDSGGASIAPRARPRMRVAARGPLAHAPVAPSTCTRCRRPSAAAAQPSDSRALPSLASQARGCSPCACSHRRARLAAGRHTRAESGLGVGSCPRLALRAAWSSSSARARRPPGLARRPARHLPEPIRPAGHALGSSPTPHVCRPHSAHPVCRVRSARSTRPTRRE